MTCSEHCGMMHEGSPRTSLLVMYFTILRKKEFVVFLNLMHLLCIFTILYYDKKLHNYPINTREQDFGT
jgi:hypothetical protein